VTYRAELGVDKALVAQAATATGAA